MTHRLAGPHRRHDPLRDVWVLVSTDRTDRPWSGQTEQPSTPPRPTYDPDCFLCPGNTRARGDVNPDYDDTFVFTNDFASLRPDTSTEAVADHPLLRMEGQRGTCRVICFSPRHDLTLARMEVQGIRRVVDLWADQYTDLSRTYDWVQVFENRGEQMGASNPHPHGQIWASSSLPTEALIEDRQQREHHAETGVPLLLDYVTAEVERDERVVVAGQHWVVVVPFWARWPYETLLLPREPVQRLDQLGNDRRDDLAEVLKHLLTSYDNLFERSFPYSMGWHCAPPGDGAHWTLHGHFYPPLLQADKQKFMVGYEMLAEAQRDLTAETAADRLRSQSRTHHATADAAAET